MIYIETDKEASRSFKNELVAAGVPATSIGASTRRSGPSGGAILEGGRGKKFPRAITIDGAEEGDRSTATAVLAAHVPNFGYVLAQVNFTKQEAGKRILNIVPEWKQRNMLARSQELRDIRLGVPNPMYDENITAEQTDPDNPIFDPDDPLYDDSAVLYDPDVLIEWEQEPRKWKMSERKEHRDMMSLWAWVNAVRTASDVMEAEILILSDEDAGNYDVENNPLWP